jgi:cytidine deaminase
MINKEIKFSYKVYDSVSELEIDDVSLIAKAKENLKFSYSPYSNFKVSAAVLLGNGEVIIGTNQENAAFPVCICAEGTALSACSAIYPQEPIKKIAITVSSGSHVVNHPVAPCGICRQRIAEYELRFGNDIELILAGETGEIYKIDSVKDILPLGFSKKEL